MSLTIRAMQNHLGTSDNPFYVLASWSRVVESEAFIDRMAAGRTTLSKTDIIAVFQLAREELGRLLADGCYVKTPLGAALPVAKGCLRSSSDPFLPKNPGSGHTIRFDFRMDPAIEEEALGSIQCVREEQWDRRSPRILFAQALPSGKEAGLEAGGLVRILGHRMKFDPADPSFGLFFSDDSRRETRAEAYALVLPSSLIAVVPSTLAAGSYSLIVRTVSKGGERLEGASERVSVGVARASPEGA